jgi:hypothetical protein
VGRQLGEEEGPDELVRCVSEREGREAAVGCGWADVGLVAGAPRGVRRGEAVSGRSKKASRSFFFLLLYCFPELILTILWFKTTQNQISKIYKFQNRVITHIRDVFSSQNIL